MPNHRNKVGILVDDLRYSWREEPQGISPSSIVLLVVFVCAAAFLMGMVWFRPWANDGPAPEVQASPPAEAQAPAPGQPPPPQAAPAPGP
jgi:hypothetical protein